MIRSLSSCCLCLVAPALADDQKVSGTVRDSAGVVPDAVVSLVTVADSAWVKSIFAGPDGVFVLNDVAPGNYVLIATACGYAQYRKQISIGAGDAAISIILEKESSLLDAVQVSARKPFLESAPGKIVVNVDASPATAGSSVYDLLRHLPGLIVNEQGSISMMGKTGVLVMIDDRPVYLSGEQLAAYLRAMNSDEVAQVELISQPSEKYDAAGNSGIINIRRKKNGKAGLNGSISAHYSHGVYGYMSGNAMISYRKGKWNAALTGTEILGSGFAGWNDRQQVLNPISGAQLSAAQIASNPVEHYGISTAAIDADYNCSEKTTVGVSLKGGYHFNSLADNVSATSEDASGGITGYNKITSPDGFIRRNMDVNLHASHKMGSNSDVSVNADLFAYYNGAHQDIANIAYDAAQKPLPDPELLSSKQPLRINIYSLKSDYTKSIGNGLKLEAGLKWSLVETDNNAAFEVFRNNVWTNDTTRSNHFIYREMIGAAYAGAEKEVGRHWQVKGGLRAEQTYTSGDQLVNSQNFTRSYLSPFATLCITWKPGSNNSLELNYGRRIERPDYNLLNPFIYYSFQYSYSEGNPYLSPEFSNNVEIKHSYRNWLITTLRLGVTQNTISNVLEVANGSTVYSIPVNLGNTKSADLSVVYAKDISRWLSLHVSGSVFYNDYKGFARHVFTEASGPGFVVNYSSQFSWPSGWKAELAGYHVSGCQASVQMFSGAYDYLSLGLSKRLKEHCTLNIKVLDPFYFYRNEEVNRLPGFYSDAVYRYDTRRAEAGCSFDLGAGAARRITSLPDESNRVKID